MFVTLMFRSWTHSTNFDLLQGHIEEFRHLDSIGAYHQWHLAVLGRESRSPSPGNGRASPLAPLRQSARIPIAQPFRGRRDGPISPSPSEGTIGSIPAQRMVSAPVELAARSVAVRSTKAGSNESDLRKFDSKSCTQVLLAKPALP
eukprot:Skav209068  [mRNA]  locus=scaffold760:384395:391026:+ [translate_table: standard]